MQALKIALVPLARVNFDLALAESTTKTFRTNLIFHGFRVITRGDLVTDLEKAQQVIQELRDADFDLLLFFQATFADSTLITAIAEAVEKPVFLWGIPEERTGGRLRLNSFCGINLAAHALKLRKKRYDYAYAPPDDRGALARLRAVAEASALIRRLRSARLGVVGERPEGLDTCDLDEAGLVERFGTRIVQIDLAGVLARARQVDSAQTAGIRAELEKKLTGLDDLDSSQLNRSLAVYHVLKEVVSEEKLDGLAVRCWPEFFTELECAACGPMSMLSNELVPCSCEADINGTVMQLVLQWLSDAPAFGSDIVLADAEQDSFVLWHCGMAPLSMADPTFQSRAALHSNRGLPLLMEFPLKPGEVTLARLSRSSGQLGLVLGKGEMLRSEPSFSGTSGVIRFIRPAQEIIDLIMRNGLEHHISLTYGDHLAALAAFANLLNLPVLHL